MIDQDLLKAARDKINGTKEAFIPAPQPQGGGEQQLDPETLQMLQTAMGGSMPDMGAGGAPLDMTGGGMPPPNMGAMPSVAEIPPEASIEGTEAPGQTINLTIDQLVRLIKAITGKDDSEKIKMLTQENTELKGRLGIALPDASGAGTPPAASPDLMSLGNPLQPAAAGAKTASDKLRGVNVNKLIELLRKD